MNVMEAEQPVQNVNEAGGGRLNTIAALAVIAVAAVTLADRFNFLDRFFKGTHAEAPEYQPFKAQNEQMVSNVGMLTFGRSGMEVLGSGKVDVQCGIGGINWCQGANTFNIGVDGTFSLRNNPMKLLQEPCISYASDYTKTMVTDTLSTSGTTDPASNKNMSQLKIEPVTDAEGKIIQVKASGSLYPCHTRFDTNDPVTSGRYKSDHYVPGPIASTFTHITDRAVVAYASAAACFDGISDAENQTDKEINAEKAQKLDMDAVEEVTASYVAGRISRQHPELASIVSQPDGVLVELESPSKRREVLMAKFKKLIANFSKIDKTLPEYGEQIEMGNPVFGKFEVESCTPLQNFRIEDPSA